MKIRSTLLALTFSIVFTSAAFAQSLFFQTQLREWNVYGESKNGELNPACKGQKTYQDGSTFTLIRDLADGELYILFQNVTWSITDNPGNYQMRIVFYKNNSAFNLTAKYELLSKNTLRIRAILPEKFLPPFMDYSKMLFIMPGSISNAEITLAGSAGLIAAMSECVRQYKPQQPGINL